MTNKKNAGFTGTSEDELGSRSIRHNTAHSPKVAAAAMLPNGISPAAADLHWPTSPQVDESLRYSPTWDSDEEYFSDFTFSDICLNAFHSSGKFCLLYQE